MDQWLTRITDWLVELVKSILTFFEEMAGDFIVWCLDGVLGPVGNLIASIPAPSFMAGNIASLLNGLPPFALYVVSQINLAQAFGIISAGVAFRLTRKIFTLGQW